MSPLVTRAVLLMLMLAALLAAIEGCTRERTVSPAATVTGETADAVSAGNANPATVTPRTQYELSVERASHQAVVLEDGRVLVTGGCGGSSCETVHASTELYDPSRRVFTPAARMSEARAGHSAVRLGDGTVLVLGGWTGSSATVSAELYRPNGGVFETVDPLSQPRMAAQATLLTDGRVLVSVGETRTGQATDALDLYDPQRFGFSAGATLREPRAFHSATRLEDGRVLIVGGHRRRGAVLRSAEIYDPVRGITESTGELSAPRYKQAAVLLADGRVLVIAGSGAGSRASARHASIEIFDPASGTFSAGPPLAAPRYKIPDAAVVTGEGQVIVAGGAECPEIWRAGERSFERLEPCFGRAFEFSSASLLPDGDLLVAGGYDENINVTRQSWRLGADAAGKRIGDAHACLLPLPTPRVPVRDRLSSVALTR